MADVFLMGTSGSYSDPNRDMWREPIKLALDGIGATYFDPVVAEWNDAAALVESEHFKYSPVIAMYIGDNPTTTSLGSMAEAGFAVAKAILEMKHVVLRVKLFGDEEHKDVDRARKLLLQRANDLLKTPGAGLFLTICDNDENFQRAVVEAAIRAHTLPVLDTSN